MENFSKYTVHASGAVINIRTGKPIRFIKGKEAYCMYNDAGIRETVSLQKIKDLFKKRRKLSPQDIISIHELSKTDSMTVKQIAETFHVLSSTVSKIKNNQTFKHLINI